MVEAAATIERGHNADHEREGTLRKELAQREGALKAFDDKQEEITQLKKETAELRRRAKELRQRAEHLREK